MTNNQPDKEHPKNTKSISKKIVISGMVACFIVMTFTGILKFRELLQPFHIPYDQLPMRQISVLHDWTGVIFILLIIIHLILQRKWFASILKGNIHLKSAIIIGGILILAVAGLFLFKNQLNLQLLTQKSNNITSLKSVEIQEYQGENLSSISDFRENSIKGPQYVDIQNYRLNIEGSVDNNLSLTYDQVLSHNKYSKIVILNCVEDWSAKILWEGILLKDLLKEAGIKPGSSTVIFYAVDGYSSSLPLDYVMDNDIILAYKMNGVTIPPERGFPFQVIAEDKWGYKWVKWITKIELSNDANYKGYWERAGYNQNGDLNGSKFE